MTDQTARRSVDPWGLCHPGRDEVSHLTVRVTVPNRSVEALWRGLRLNGEQLVGLWSYERKSDMNADDVLLFESTEMAVKAIMLMDP